MKRLGFFGFLSFILVLFGLVLIGCSQGMGTDIDDTTQGGRSVEGEAVEAGGDDGSAEDWRSNLAKLKAMGDHKVTEVELRRMVINTFSQTTGINRTRIEKIKNIPVNNKYRFRNDGFVENEYESDPIELFEYTVSGDKITKYVFACTDARVGHIIAITDDSIEDADNDFTHYFNASVQDYIDATVLVYNDISAEEVEAARAELGAERLEPGRAVVTGTGNTNSSGWKHYATRTDMTVSKQPMLTTSWGQGVLGAYNSTGYAYNNYIKYRKGNNWWTGCVPLAIAQIVTYHQYMDTSSAAVKAEMAPSFNTNNTNRIPNMGTWNAAVGYDFALLRNNPVIKNTAPDKVKGQVAALLYHTHQEVDAYLTKDGGVAARMQNARDAFIRFGYNTYLTSGTETTVTGTNNGTFPITYNQPVSRVINALNGNSPFIICGETTSIPPSAHAWVVDGYGYASTIIEFHNKPGTSDTAQRKILLGGNKLMVHCNLGYNGNNYGYAYGGNGVNTYQTDKSKGGWFIYGVFNLENNLPTQNITAGTWNYSTLTRILIPTR